MDSFTFPVDEFNLKLQTEKDGTVTVQIADGVTFVGYTAPQAQLLHRALNALHNLGKQHAMPTRLVFLTSEPEQEEKLPFEEEEDEEYDDQVALAGDEEDEEVPFPDDHV